MNDFCVYILTHGRPSNVKTLAAMSKSGYTGTWFLVVDDQDKTLPEYQAKYKDKVKVFSKAEIAKTFDTYDNSTNNKTIVYARNACFEIAKADGYKYFMQFDDDYTAFAYKVAESNSYKEKKIKNLDRVILSMLDFYKSAPVNTIAMAQGGDFIGGAQNPLAKSNAPKRKAMNSFLCSTERPFQFLGRINEDVNTYTLQGSRGFIFFTITQVMLHQAQTQKQAGGMSEVYTDNGTYLKSFYSVMGQPSSVKIGMMGETHKRLHHVVKWANTVPCILSEKYKKQGENSK